jgi:hypothetical protein
LRDIISHPAFERGAISTEFLQTHAELLGRRPAGPDAEAAALIASLLAQKRDSEKSTLPESSSRGVTRDPWIELGAWSNT